MALKLVLEAGGSRLKWAWLENGALEAFESALWPDARAVLGKWLESRTDLTAADSPVSGLLDRPTTPAAVKAGFPGWLADTIGVEPLRLDPCGSCPFEIEYREGTPGSDRLAAAIACHHREPQSSFIIVDAGTCITVDLLSPGRWRGGAIIPGLALQSASLAQAGLPVLRRGSKGWPYRNGSPGALGRTTMEAIEAGIPWAARQAVLATARALMDIDPSAQVVLTGGDADHFDGIGGWRTFADPNLVLSGTAHLLNASTA